MKQATEMILEKVLPQALDAERFVLAGALLGHTLGNITATLQADDFSLEKHKRIFAAMVHLEATGIGIDRLTVGHELTRRGQLESVDGHSYLVSLDEGMPRLENLDSYISTVHDTSIRRRAIQLHYRAIEECQQAVDPTPEILERAERDIAVLAKETHVDSLRSPRTVINGAGGIEEMLDPKRGGIETPWPQLNQMLTGRGFMPGQMIVIGARPSMGKTALGCQIADFASEHGTDVAFFTLEMSAELILMRMAAARAEVNAFKVTQDCANNYEMQRLREAFSDLAGDGENSRLWIDDRTGCTIPSMRAALRRRSARKPVGLVVIDYLQLLETSGGSDRRRYEQVSDISRGLKRLAREFSVPVVVLAQLNREMEKDSRKPRPSDLRDSGSIEQDADIILMPSLQDGQDEHAETLRVDLNIAKQRNGPRGRVPLTFLKRYAKFIEPSSAATA